MSFTPFSMSFDTSSCEVAALDVCFAKAHWGRCWIWTWLVIQGSLRGRCAGGSDEKAVANRRRMPANVSTICRSLSGRYGRCWLAWLIEATPKYLLCDNEKRDGLKCDPVAKTKG